MEKLGVVLDDDKTKTASTSTSCPQCGGTIENGARWCPNCGTEPWEKRPEKKDE